jgi:hypothetical protein
MLQSGASLTYDTSSVNYNCNMFIIQVTELLVLGKPFSLVRPRPESGAPKKVGQDLTYKQALQSLTDM